MQPERTAGCHTLAGPDRRRREGQVALGNRRAQGQGGERHRRSVGWCSYGIHEDSVVVADDGSRRQVQAGRCDNGPPATTGPQEERGACRRGYEEEGRGVKSAVIARREWSWR